jgi:hypothetical protein
LVGAVRARAIARARAALAAGVARRAPSSPPRTLWSGAAVFGWLLGAAAAAGAYQVRAHLALPSVRRAATAPVSIAAPARPPIPYAPIETDLPPAPEQAPGQPASSSQAGAARAELRLLRQARAAVAREDHAAALPFIAEHARRFKNGRLAEEREALRVKALAGAGRLDEAQLAAAAFRARFSHSVLLPVVSQLAPCDSCKS